LRIIGIDPGSNVTGYGMIERHEGKLVHVAHGTLRPQRGAALAIRLEHLYRTLAEILADHRPDVAAVEQVFVSASPKAALVLGQARGVALAALSGAGLAVNEYTPSQVKQAVTGSGRAPKSQVKHMVRRMLALERTPAEDAADALAVAIRHASGGRLEEAGVVPRRRRSSSRRSGIVINVRPQR
jgi:crossover junction endodeoxyribonuclease RuvC